MVLDTIQLIQANSTAFCIVSDMVRRGWVGILIVGDENIPSTLDARRDGRYFLGKLERLAMRTLCYSIPEADWIGLARFPSTEAIDAGSRGLLLLLCVTRACPLKRDNYFATRRTRRGSKPNGANPILALS